MPTPNQSKINLLVSKLKSVFASSNHTHNASNISYESSNVGTMLLYLGNGITDLGTNKANNNHTHNHSDVVDLDSVVEGKVKSMLNSYFDGKVAKVKVENGELVVEEWEDGDFV